MLRVPLFCEGGMTKFNLIAIARHLVMVEHLV